MGRGGSPNGKELAPGGIKPEESMGWNPQKPLVGSAPESDYLNWENGWKR
jgi:hypothetical protein